MTDTTVSSGVTSSGITLSNGDNAFVYGTAVSFTMSNGGQEIVYSGGVASFTTVSSGGAEVVSSGGTADFTTISFGGTEDVYSGGTTSFTTVSGGTEYVYSGGAASFTLDESSLVLTGGTTFSTTVGYEATLTVSDGGRAISTAVSHGFEDVDSGGAASFTTLNSDSFEDVFNGGTTSLTTVSSGCAEDVSSGGESVSTTVSDLGFEYLLSSGTASGTMLTNGGDEVLYAAHARAISTTVGGGGGEIIDSGGTARDTVLDPGGQIDVTYIFYTSGGSATVNSSDLLTVSVGDQTYTQQLSGEYAGVTFSLSPGRYGGTAVTNEAPCYRSGTRIRTDRGEIAIEDLRVGDLVRTVLGDATAPIVWIGRREVDCARHPKPRKVWPVRVAAGAFGPAQPHTDLFLSPDHAVYVGKVLIPIHHLINGTTIAQVPMDRVTYYHLELLQHDVVLAEGLPAESFLDIKDGSNYANRPGPVRLYADYTARMWEAFGCARLIVTGPELELARALVRRFARMQEAA